MLGIVFWVTLVGGGIATGLAGAMYPAETAEFDPDALRVSYGFAVAGATTAAIASVTGALFVRRVSNRLASARIIIKNR
jgi:ABC-type Fe3+ transport system permease subunit